MTKRKTASGVNVTKLTTIVIVDAIEPALAMWTNVLGFEKTVEVPSGDKLGFVILVRDRIELMLQTRASIAGDLPMVVETGVTHMLYADVASLDDAIASARHRRGRRAAEKDVLRRRRDSGCAIGAAPSSASRSCRRLEAWDSVTEKFPTVFPTAPHMVAIEAWSTGSVASGRRLAPRPGCRPGPSVTTPAMSSGPSTPASNSSPRSDCYPCWSSTKRACFTRTRSTICTSCSITPGTAEPSCPSSWWDCPISRSVFDRDETARSTPECIIASPSGRSPPRTRPTASACRMNTLQRGLGIDAEDGWHLRGERTLALLVASRGLGIDAEDSRRAGCRPKRG